MDARMSFLVQVNESDESFAALCRRYGISRKTGYKWVERYEQQGPAGLKDRPPLASHHPDRVPEALVDILVATRKEHPFWGPKKLRAWLLEHRPEHPWPVLPRPVIDGRSIRLGDGIPSAGAKSRPPRGWSEGQVVASVVGEGARAPVSVDGGEQVVGAAEDVEGSAGLVVVAHSCSSGQAAARATEVTSRAPSSRARGPSSGAARSCWEVTRVTRGLPRLAGRERRCRVPRACVFYGRRVARRAWRRGRRRAGPRRRPRGATRRRRGNRAPCCRRRGRRACVRNRRCPPG